MTTSGRWWLCAALTLIASAVACGRVPGPATAAVPPSPSPTSFTTTDVSQGLSWSGTRAGSLTTANTECADRYGAYLFRALDGQRFLVITPSAGAPQPYRLRQPGKYSLSYAEIQLYLGDTTGPGIWTAWLSTGGTVTVNPGGLSGSVDAELEPQTSHAAANGVIHLVGTWSCLP